MQHRLFIRNCFFIVFSCLCTPKVLADSEILSTALDPARDYHSFANPDEVDIKHLDLDLSVDFKAKKLRGFVILTLQKKQTTADKLILDTRDLNIKSVKAGDNNEWMATPYHLRPTDPTLGSALVIQLPAAVRKIKIDYETSPTASGLQWLQPQQTAGKRHPFLFTQAQAIHARSFIPLQDTPQVRVTYTAVMRTPSALRAVMSAANDPQAPRNGVYKFTMPQAIPAYLIALAVGDLHFKAMGKRTGVYAEAELLDAASAEFADTEAMLAATEKRFGPYSWGRYDLLILPPSFPFGGMENPRLSFITPTVIAGDKSLVSLIAHELAHSWSGNSVTNATWRDLWLNEGFTTYLTYRIMELVYGVDRFNMERALGYQDLQEEIKSLPPADQLLAIDLRGRDPDDNFSDVPYEKGALMLVELEQQVGRANFDRFLRVYFKKYAFQSLTTEAFIDYLTRTLIKQYPDKISTARLRQWIYEPGIPAGAPVAVSSAFRKIDALVKQWLAGKLVVGQINTDRWTVHEWLYFLSKLPEQLGAKQLAELDKAFALTASSNNEIAHSWLLIAIRNDYSAAFERLENYLVGIGRRKLIRPLYEELVKTQQGVRFARRVYKKARQGYHPLAQGTIDEIVTPVVK